MKNIIKTMLLLISILILTTVNTNAQNLVLIKKDKFTTCEDIFYHGNYKGNGEYTIYDENKNPYITYCNMEITMFKQKDFSGLLIEEINNIMESNLDKIKIYHSEDLYFVFNKEDREDIVDRKRFILRVSDAIKNVNKNNVIIGDYIIVSVHDRMSGVLTSNSLSGWCSPINGRYNGGCFNGSTGIGDWEIKLF